MPLNKDSIGNTFLVATLLCLACSALVSTAAVGLKKIQNDNILLDKRANILKVSGFTEEDIEAAGGINELFKDRFDTLLIDLETGELAAEEAAEAMKEAGKTVSDDTDAFVASYDQHWCSKSKKAPVSDELSKSEDIVGIKYREKFSHVYVLKSDDDKVEKYVFPVRSYGLWSMMKGYMAVEPDLQTVAGLTFYEQAETPGLGGEIMNPNWKAKWPGKKIYDGDKVGLEVSKTAEADDPYAIDALSGATITSKGVTNLVEFWMGPSGFGPFIENRKAGDSAAANPKSTPAESGVNHG